VKCYYELAHIQYHKLGNKTTLSVIGFAYIVLEKLPILKSQRRFCILRCGSAANTPEGTRLHFLPHSWEKIKVPQRPAAAGGARPRRI